MTTTTVAYVGLDHLHRDPYFALIDALPVELVASCEPNEAFDVASLRPDPERPDEVAVGDLDMGQMVADVPLYRDPEAMFSEVDADVAWVALSNRDTPGVVEAAVDAGLDVFSEKPMARTAADLEPVAKRADERGVSVGVNYFYRTHPTAIDLRDLLGDGVLGDLLAVEARYMGSTLGMRDTSHFIYDAAASRGGALQWLGVHWIDLLLWILDDPIDRVCAQVSRRTPGVDIEDAATLQFETHSGATGTYQTGYSLRETTKDSSFRVYGTDGHAASTLGRGPDPVELDLYSTATDWSGAPTRRIAYDYAYDRFPAWGDATLRFFEQVVEAFDAGERPPADVEDALQVLRVLDAAYASAETGGWVETGL